MAKLSEAADKLLTALPATGTLGGGALQAKAKLRTNEFKEALKELVDQGRVAVGRGRGGSIHRIDEAAPDDKTLLAKLTPTLQPNSAVREALSWDEARYWQAHRALRAQGLIQVGRGQGGTVALVPVASDEDEGEEVTPPKAMPTPPQRNGDERSWYPLLAFVLAERWAPEQGFTKSRVDVTAYSGRKVTGGHWSRPDITATTLQTYRLLPDRRLEVWSFEVKRPGDWSVVGVHEASALGRRATRPTLLLVSTASKRADLSPSEQEVLGECELEASRLGVGLIVAYAPYGYENWEHMVDADAHEPAPDRMHDFLETQLSPEAQEAIADWLK